MVVAGEHNAQCTRTKRTTRGKADRTEPHACARPCVALEHVDLHLHRVDSKPQKLTRRTDARDRSRTTFRAPSSAMFDPSAGVAKGDAFALSCVAAVVVPMSFSTCSSCHGTPSGMAETSRWW